MLRALRAVGFSGVGARGIVRRITLISLGPGRLAFACHSMLVLGHLMRTRFIGMARRRLADRFSGIGKRGNLQKKKCRNPFHAVLYHPARKARKANALNICSEPVLIWNA